MKINEGGKMSEIKPWRCINGHVLGQEIEDKEEDDAGDGDTD